MRQLYCIFLYVFPTFIVLCTEYY
ncbi:unnamed protein product [Spirodela intermedia]|uniref:Uncharacterized protein n=1 Tax=Spirodela intermedia TaxID=51605 RepID=A0A7I8KH60_SPIIN|nr:unnamed protein product [Spirodela intermedia]